MIRIDGVRVDLGGEAVLRGVDASIDGGFVGLVGPNGAGKTTLLRTVNGRIDPDEGAVFVGGDLVSDLPAREIGRRVATVPQETAVSFEFTVREVVEMGRYPHRPRFGIADDDDAVDRALERTEVADLADRPVTAVSGGERGRVLVARALAQAAPVLLLDEPTASLDLNHQVRIMDLVCDLVDADGVTAVAAIHDLDLAARYCDRLLLLYGGSIRAAGPPAEVLTEPRLREAFDVPVVVETDPVTGTPTVTAVSEPGERADRKLSAR